MLLDDAMMLVDGHGMTCDEKEINMKEISPLACSISDYFPPEITRRRMGLMRMFISSTKGEIEKG